MDTLCARCCTRPSSSLFCGAPTCDRCRSAFLSAPERKAKLDRIADARAVLEAASVTKLTRDASKASGTWAARSRPARVKPWPKVCRAGHDLTGSNLRILPGGSRYSCGICREAELRALRDERAALRARPKL